MTDQRLHQLLSEVSDDLPNLDRVRLTVRDRVRRETRLRRGAALGLSAAAVLVVSAGIFWFPHTGQSGPGPAGPPAPTSAQLTPTHLTPAQSSPAQLSSAQLSSPISKPVTESGASSANGTPPVNSLSPGPTPTSRVQASPATLTAAPALGSTNLSPAQPISISVQHATITELTVTAPGGKTVQGALSADRTRWTLGEVLGFGKTYTVTGIAKGTDGRSVPINGTYSTVGAETRADAFIEPADGAVVGIAEPIIIRFPVEPTDKAAIERALTVTTTPAVEGSWGWIHHDDAWGVDWRPKGYWPAGTKVHVSAKIYGIKLAAGQYASSDLTSDFTIGRSQVVYADAKSFQIVVRQGCTAISDPTSCAKTVATYPASFGSGDDVADPNRVTRSGIHVVNELLPVHLMSNPAYGYDHVTEYWDVRISNNGEFIHQNQGTTASQGLVNVSHGCINLSAVNAKAYFQSALIGDPVEVTGTSVPLSANDGDLFDWTIPWSQWQKLSAR